LREVKFVLVAKHDEQLEMIKVPRRDALVPYTADIDDKAAGTFENAIELFREWPEPI
jgi:hypothetical protein